MNKVNLIKILIINNQNRHDKNHKVDLFGNFVDFLISFFFPS